MNDNNNAIKGNISLKKKKKELNLYNSAYELFKEKGINSTSIDEIVKSAGVAKGTFYLYFKDKYDVVNKLILLKGSTLIEEAFEATKDRQFVEFEDMVLYFTEYIIDYFKENKLLLKVINKNFSHVIHRNAKIMDEDKKVIEIIDIFLKELIKRGLSEDEGKITLFMIIELVGSVCYSSIILNEPDDIEVIKPILFKKIKMMLK
ncbi:TetR/AcrR family transcriptional regulator [Clostridium sardiniense]|uniref:TetR/AcrR family transcriptional regulator n=1 Tax=Clostridium sardiniense TaxID=29369 RepID=A0ABS7KZZ0_CLOSR|nr:TetR/AcrR family transcriptional regulator [Clostridium sardiniense]MBM7833590.1 AcrR family transcriptional regulator [Clostridium sardiniense]MBY0756207.1 TetR/AcrR family transcriptional regulator [Clostridium sardiniense]MDQ0458850.1 AcrR family transcriptional regulator [Clostridium sardiniense]